jgi:AraC-like DNA-binding protein
MGAYHSPLATTSFIGAISNGTASFYYSRALGNGPRLVGKKASKFKRIAQQSGYADESSFRRAFTRFVGMSPNAYRHWVQQRERQDAATRSESRSMETEDDA